MATNISGNRDVVTHGENGYLVKPSDEEELADAILQILKQDHVQNQMSARAREVALQYDWTNIARRYVEVYREAIEMNGSQ